MLQKRNNSAIIKFLFSRNILTVIGLAVIILISVPLAKNVSQRYKVNQEIGELESEINELEKQNTNLKKFVDYLGSDQFVEEQARLNLGLKKEGEEVAVVKLKSAESQSGENNQGGGAVNSDISGAQSDGKPAIVGNPKKWRDYFFK